MSVFSALFLNLINDRQQLLLPIAVLGLIVVCWSLIRPSMFLDANKKRLPFKLLPRALFSFISLSIYLMLFTFIFAFPGYAAQTLKQLAFSGLFAMPDTSGSNFAGNPATLALEQTSWLKERAPYFAVLAQGLLLQLRFVRDIETSIAVWLHSRRHLFDDITDFAHFLQTKPFDPREDERQKNRAYVRRFGLNVTDLTLDAVGLVTFERWEKVATLVRALKEWVAQDPTVLTPEEHKQIEVLEEAHDRKTALAVNIIRLISDGGGDVLSMLREARSPAPSNHTDARAKLEEWVAASSPDKSDHALALTGDQLHRRLEQIQQVFDDEYKDLLDQTAFLAARAVMLARPALADQRFERLKLSGFDFLGHLPRVSFDKLLATFVAVAVPGFFVMFFANRGSGGAGAEALARFVCVMAIAALIGVAVGSRKTNVTSEDVPWSRYIAAGVVSAAIFVCVNLATYQLKRTLGTQLPPTPNIAQSVLWSTLPLLVTIAIAVLARHDTWSTPKPLGPWSDIWERVVDGMAVSTVVCTQYFLALTVYSQAGWKMPNSIAGRMDSLRFLPYPVPWELITFGFLIGAFAVRNARHVAHRTILKRAPAKSSQGALPIAPTPAAA